MSKSCKPLYPGFFLLGAATAVLVFAAPQTCAAALRHGLALCGGSLLVSLFPFLVVSALIMRSGAGEVLGVLLTRCDRRRSSVQQVRDDLIAALGDKVFDAMIPYLTEASNAPRERRSCVSKPGSEIGRAYMAVAKEVLVR